MEGADSRTTSKVLAGMIDKLGGADLVICSEASDDEYAQQTSARLAALLGYASVTYVQHVEVSGEQIKLSRKLDDGTEDVEVAEPTVISVVPDINDPPIPSLKQILGAKKKPSIAVALAELGFIDRSSQLRTESVLAPVVARKQIQLTAGGVSIADAVIKLTHQLSSDGVL
jgi:electron transfer flavoprotein beta subunit